MGKADIWDETDNSFKGYFLMKMPMMTARDHCFVMYTQVSDDKVILVMDSIDDARHPKEGNVRMLYQRFLIAEKLGPKESKVTMVVTIDMGLWVPGFLMNWMIGKGFNTHLENGLMALRAWPERVDPSKFKE